MTTITNINQLDFSKTYTYADYLKWQFEERIELLRGFLFPMSAPSRYHQKISGELQYQISAFFRKSPCSVYVAPFDVRLIRKDHHTNKEITTVLQPDLCVICDKSKLDKRGCLGAPDWIIEILSPGNSKKEMKEKYQLYEENGVREYWLVQTEDKIVLRYVLNEAGKYIGLAPLTDDDMAQPTIFTDLNIDLKEVFED
jgi:Uma2 family endonuclease